MNLLTLFLPKAYYQSNAPLAHSYTKPTVKINKKINIELNPQKPI
jgi:hypothetical protein